MHKETANFCDYFRPVSAAYRSTIGTQRDSARSRLDTLFGERADADSGDDSEQSPGPVSKEEEARARLDALFGKDADS